MCIGRYNPPPPSQTLPLSLPGMLVEHLQLAKLSSRCWVLLQASVTSANPQNSVR